jgi:hypothetical protein
VASKAGTSTKKAGPSVDDVLASIDHPLKADVAQVRKAILSVDKSISDGVKWNSLSFRTTEWFATWNWRTKDQVQLVLHLGAKPGKVAPAAAIPDPKGLLKWLGKDRAMASLGSGAGLKANLPALKAVIKAWLQYV